MMTWRSMTSADLPGIKRVADVVHQDFPESDAVFEERLRLYAAGCFVLCDDKPIAGYVVSHPWRYRKPPALNSLLQTIPCDADTYYVHDIALHGDARRSGSASEIVRILVKHAREHSFPNLSLIAVSGSSRFWQRHGFAVVSDADIDEKLVSYGSDARFMTLTLERSHDR